MIKKFKNWVSFYFSPVECPADEIQDFDMLCKEYNLKGSDSFKVANSKILADLLNRIKELEKEQLRKRFS